MMTLSSQLIVTEIACVFFALVIFMLMWGIKKAWSDLDILRAVIDNQAKYISQTETAKAMLNDVANKATGKYVKPELRN